MKDAGIYQPPAYRPVKELGFVQPEDKEKRIIVWKVDVQHKRKGVVACQCRREFYHHVFYPFQVWLFMFNLINVVVFVELSQTVKEIVKISNTGSAIG